MPARHYKPTLDRQSLMWLEPSLEACIQADSIARAIDAYVETLRLDEYGFKYATPTSLERHPPYNPQQMLKLYLYGYLEGIRSSRKLERETRRNVEVIWLIEGILPVYKTIADFRKDNLDALKKVNKQFTNFCKKLALFGGEVVGADGSFFKGDVSTKQIYTQECLDKQLSKLEKRIAHYHEQLEAQDKAEDEIQEKLTRLQEKLAEKQALEKQLNASSDTQIAHVDKDARLLRKRGKTIAGYNVQIAVDSKYNLIIAQNVVQDGNDKQQLYPMLSVAKQTLEADTLQGLADSGYFESQQLKQCEDANIEVYVPRPAQNKKRDTFDRSRFAYDSKQNAYTCPNGKMLNSYGKPINRRGKNYIRYRSGASDCKTCTKRQDCLGEKSKTRGLERWEHEAVLERHHEKMQQAHGRMTQRAALVEHPFGTLKNRAGMHHFLMRGLDKCRAEFSLMIWSYNFTRAFNLLGMDKLKAACA